MRFWGLTVSLVPMADDLFTEAGRIRDPLLIPEALENIAAIPLLDQKNKFGLGRAIRNDSDLIGFYTRREIAHLFDTDFQRNDQPSYPPRLWVWDHKEQTLLVQIDKSIFTTAESAAKAFESVLASKLAVNQLEVHIYPKVSEEYFWSSVDDFASINEVTFEFVTPNMFGSTKAEMTSYLKTVRNETNANVVATKLINKDGNLIPKRSGFLARSLDWIKDGGGKWLIKGRLYANSRITNRGSGRQAQIYILADGTTKLNAAGYTANDLIKIIAALRIAYTFKSNNFDK